LPASGAGAMMVGMRRVGRGCWVAVVLMVGCLGCRRQVQAPLTEVAPVPGMPFLVPVDLSNPEQHPFARAMPSADEAARGRKVVKVSAGVSSAMLARRPVNLAYPTEAKEQHLTGKVDFRAILAEDGTVKGLTVLEPADPLFVPAAIAAVQSWQYRPYLLNGKPVAVDTTITVNFSLSQ
jgi:TonB family protein